MNENEIVRILLNARVKLQVSIWAVIRDGHAVDDIFQDVMLRALENRDQYRKEAHLLAWVRVTARNLAIDLLRQKERQTVLLDHQVLERVCDTSEAEDARLASGSDALRWCLEKLPRHSRSLLNLRYGQGLRGSRIAKQIDRTLDAVYQRLSRIHRRLRRCVQDRLAAEEVAAKKVQP